MAYVFDESTCELGTVHVIVRDPLPPAEIV
jgi:hypothetical protein